MKNPNYPLSAIPNTFDFRLVVVLKDGREFPAYVDKDGDGKDANHFLADISTDERFLTKHQIQWSDLSHWRRV